MRQIVSKTDGMTVNDRAKLLADALGVSLSRIASMLLMHVSYFSNCTGKQVPIQTRNTMRALFPELNVRWLFDGEGQQDLSKVSLPKYLGQLTQYNPAQYMKIMKNGSPDVIRQYLTDNDVPVAEFVQLYGSVYRSLFPLIDTNAPATPVVYDDQPATDASVAKLVDSLASLTATVASMQETIASQQAAIKNLTSLLSKVES